jgi:O-antigen/teichoic acid export membrane protein
MSGAATAQLVNLAVAPLLTRLYGPAAYGELGIFIAILSVLSAFAAFGYPPAIVLARSDEEARALWTLSVGFGGAVAAVVLFFLLIFESDIRSLAHLGSDPFLLFLIPVIVWFEALFQAGQQWLIRLQRYGFNATVLVFQAVVSGVVKVVGGVVHPTGTMLVATALLAVPLNAATFLVALRQFGVRLSTTECSSTELKSVARKYIDFPFYRMPQSLVYVLGQMLPLIVVNSVFGVTAAGYLALTTSVLGAPTQILGKVVNDVFTPTVARTERDGQPILDLTLHVIAALGCVSILPFAIVIVFGPQLFGLVFGERWTPAGEYARWLTFAALSSLCSKPMFTTLVVLRRQGFLLVVGLASIVLRLGSLVIGHHWAGDLAGIAAMAVAGTLMDALLFIFGCLACREHDRIRPGSRRP